MAEASRYERASGVRETMSDVHKQVGLLTEFTPGNDTARVQLDARIEQLQRYIGILESKLDRETLKECIAQRNTVSENDGQA